MGYSEKQGRERKVTGGKSKEGKQSEFNSLSVHVNMQKFWVEFSKMHLIYSEESIEQ